MLIVCQSFFHSLLRQINFEREPRRHFLTLLGYDPMELSKKVCTVHVCRQKLHACLDFSPVVLLGKVLKMLVYPKRF